MRLDVSVKIMFNCNTLPKFGVVAQVVVQCHSTMEDENSNDSLLKERYMWMLKIAKLRRKVPKTLIKLDRQMQRKEVEHLSTLHNPDKLKYQIKEYVKKCGSDQSKVPNCEMHIYTVSRAFEEFPKINIALNNLLEQRYNVDYLLEKVEHHCKTRRNFAIAQQQLQNENPLITQSRVEGYEMIKTQQKSCTEEENSENKNKKVRLSEEITKEDSIKQEDTESYEEKNTAPKRSFQAMEENAEEKIPSDGLLELNTGESFPKKTRKYISQ